MDRFAIFVDAGYFFAAGATAAFGQNVPRREISIQSAQTLMDDLSNEASKIASDLPFLRTYWYDAMPGPRLSLDQTELAMLKGVKLRLGVLNSAGEQKGVDSLIVTDLIELARNGAIADAVIVSGDDDLRIAVQLAQSFGVRVHILAAGDPAKNVSPSIQMDADSVSSLTASWFQLHLVHKGSKPVTPDTTSAWPAGPAPITANTPSLRTAASQVFPVILPGTEVSKVAQLRQHFETQTTVPPEFDRPMVAKAAEIMERRLTGDEKRELRGLFITYIREIPGDA